MFVTLGNYMENKNNEDICDCEIERSLMNGEVQISMYMFMRIILKTKF